MQTIIVTGGAGYIGSHTIIELLENTDFRVVSLDNYSNSSEHSYGQIRKISSRNFETAQVDLCDLESTQKVIDRFSPVAGIIHFAAFKSVPDSMADPLLYYHNNNDSLLNLLQICREKNIHNFIFSSSCSVYGNSKDLPVTEDSILPRAESAYGHTKQMGEEMLRFFCHAQKDFKAILLRYFNPVGAHMSGLIGEYPINKPTNLVPIITQTAVGKNQLTVFGSDYDTRDGYCIRDFVHVSDVAAAHVFALRHLLEEKNKKNLEVYNLGTGNGVSVLEAIRSFEKVSGKKLPYKVGPRREGDVVAIYANNDKARKELNWECRYSLDDMMSSAWKWQNRILEEGLF